MHAVSAGGHVLLIFWEFRFLKDELTPKWNIQSLSTLTHMVMEGQVKSLELHRQTALRHSSAQLEQMGTIIRFLSV